MGYLEQFHHQIYGDNNSPKLVFLHGLMGFSANWRKIVSHFEKDFQILTYDQRGHGRSMKPASGYGPEDYADDLIKILAELNWQKINLVGHSMGGRNALNFASRHPEKLISLVIEDVGPESNPGDIERYTKMLGRIPTPFKNKREAKQFLVDDYDDKVMGNYFYSNLAENDEGLVDWRFSKSAILESVRMGRTHDRWDEVRAIKTPTLLIRGENSLELLQSMYEKMLQTNKMIEGVVVPHAAHWVHFDQAEKFSEILKTFLYNHQVPKVN